MHILEAGGRTVAKDLADVFGSFDAAILDVARLTTSIMETKQTAVGVTEAQSQRFIDSVADGFSKAVEGRRSIVAAQRALVLLKQGSNLDVYDFGCLGVDELQGASKLLPVG